MNDMRREQLQRDSGGLQLVEPESDPICSTQNSNPVLRKSPKIALLTPYTGGNLGDAAIQDAAIANIRLRLPDAEFSGITLKCSNFLAQHGTGAFPLVGAGIPFFKMEPENASGETDPRAGEIRQPIWRRILRRMPGASAFKRLLRATSSWLKLAQAEMSHAVKGYRFLRTQNLLIISGGGQLDEEYGGAWGLPYALFKWTFLARLARVPCVMASVGAGRIALPASRRFISTALRLCCYRSFREEKSRAIAAGLYPRAMKDAVVPDLAFSMPRTDQPSQAVGIRKMAQGRRVIALSPMAYAKPGDWPTPNRDLHVRYVEQLARLLPQLAERGYFIVVACSSLGDDESVISDIIGGLSEEARRGLEGQIHFSTAKTWKELMLVLRESDCLIASRLHGAILGFISQVPAVAISVDPKVDWVMEDLQQTEYLLHFRDFTAEDVLDSLDRIQLKRDVVVERIASYRKSVLSNPISGNQYDHLAGLASKYYQG
jgi:polysaccharide pyruvyl transferase WcaK-like protein